MPKSAKDWIKEAWTAARGDGIKTSSPDEFVAYMADYLEGKIFNYTDEVADTNSALVECVNKALDTRIDGNERLRDVLSGDAYRADFILELRDILEGGLKCLP